jgi:exoribonuclease R
MLRHVEAIHTHTTTDTNILIEHLMVQTNRIVTEFIDIPQRHHPESRCSDIDATSLLDVIHLLKQYKRAIYSDGETGHFGLKLSTYTHFTSPIRRQFDCIIHNMLAGYKSHPELLQQTLEYLNTREREIDGMNRLYNTWKMGSYLEAEKNRGLILRTANVISVSRAGITYYIPELFIEGFIHVSNILSGVRWTFMSEEGKRWLQNQDSTIQIHPNAEIRVRFIQMDWVQSVWRFSVDTLNKRIN